ncbi:hypothetical protein AB0M02_26020 [Actinoplanes sp. NPDC051861]|uniref:hypothetical protein n=1 Tax=Actinoplanes sp. NPDC051861 TaxID=3155170 RepID=UPI003415DCFD
MRLMVATIATSDAEKVAESIRNAFLAQPGIEHVSVRVRPEGVAVGIFTTATAETGIVRAVLEGLGFPHPVIRNIALSEVDR